MGVRFFVSLTQSIRIRHNVSIEVVSAVFSGTNSTTFLSIVIFMGPPHLLEKLSDSNIYHPKHSIIILDSRYYSTQTS
jgi:hypothetical protein